MTIRCWCIDEAAKSNGFVELSTSSTVTGIVVNRCRYRSINHPIVTYFNQRRKLMLIDNFIFIRGSSATAIWSDRSIGKRFTRLTYWPSFRYESCSWLKITSVEEESRPISQRFVRCCYTDEHTFRGITSSSFLKRSATFWHVFVAVDT